VFGGSLVSIGPLGGLREGLFFDFGSPLRSSVGRGVVFEGQLDTPFGSKSHVRRVGRVGHVRHVGAWGA